jgi:hypothetical protein
MPTKISDDSLRKELQLATTLWNLYHHPERAPFRFKARSLAQARIWQRKTRKALLDTLGFNDLSRVAPAPCQAERVDKGDYIRGGLYLPSA